MKRRYFLAAMVVFVLCIAVVHADITTSLVGHWACDDNLIDQTTNSNNGTLIGGVSYDADSPLVSGKSINIPWPDGYTSLTQAQNYVSLGTATEHNFSTGNWTIAAWVKSTLTDRGNIFSNGGDESDGIRYVMAVGEKDAGKVVLTTDDNSTKVQVVSTGRVNDGQWHHIVGVRDGSTMRLYIDGQGDSEKTLSGVYDLSGTSQHGSYIGCGFNHSSGVVYKQFDGNIDEVRLYNRALPSSDITELYLHNKLSDPPDVDAGEDQSFRYPCQRAVQLHGIVEDDDPQGLGILTIQWSQLSGPTPMQFEDVNDPSTIAWFSEVGEYQLMLQAWDEVPQEANDITIITVDESIIGDLNCDNRVDNPDLARLAEQWLDPVGCQGYPIGCADLIGADGVDLTDCLMLAGNWLMEWPTVTIAATDPSAAEAGQDPGVFTIIRSDTQGYLIVNYDVSGTATSNDYTTLLTGEVLILQGQYSATINITPLDDGESEGIENVRLTLVSGSGYLTGLPDTASVPILDNDISSLESSDMIVELTADPYSYRVVEKSTLEVILDQSTSHFKFSGGDYPVQSAYNISITATTMEVDLTLTGIGKIGHVKFTFEQSDLLKVILSCNNDTPENIKEEFVDQGEHYYGIWEYPQGQNIDNRGADHDLLGFGGMLDTNFANARAPFYVTSGKYGIYVDTVALGHYTVAGGGTTSFDFDQEQMSYYVIYGPDYANILDVYNDLAGPAWMPPDWAFDSVWWRDDDHNDFGHWDLVENRTIDSAEKNVMATANHLQYYRIPASTIWIDRPYTSGSWGWGNNDFNPTFDWFPSGNPSGQSMIDYLENKGYYLLLWIANRCSNNLYDEGIANGYLFNYDSHPAADVRWPEVYNWFKDKLDNFVNMGIRGYKIDRGHEHEMGATWAEHDAVENEVIAAFAELAAEGQIAAHGGEYLIHARNAFDKSRKYLGVWNGDTDSDFGGLRVSIKNGLRCGAMNFPYFGSDIGGYLSNNVSQELFTRWFQFGTYSTMMEILIDPDRTIWYESDYPQSATPNMIEMARQQCQDHHDLIPYTKAWMYHAHQTGMPVMRQMIFEFPDDTDLYDMWNEYFYGPEILVAPVTSPGATSRSVYLPTGEWLDYNDKDTPCTGPDTITASAPIDEIPLFVREGAIIPRGDILKSNNNWTANWAPYLRIEFFPQNDVSRSFPYYTGTAIVPIDCSMSSGGVIDINFAALDHDGTLEIYCRQYLTVTKNGSPLTEGIDFTYDAQKHLLTIPCSGVTTIEITGVTSIFTSL